MYNIIYINLLKKNNFKMSIMFLISFLRVLFYIFISFDQF